MADSGQGSAASGGAHVFATLGGASHADAQLAGDVAGLNALDDGGIKAVISSVVGFLQNPRGSDIAAEATAFAKAHGQGVAAFKNSVRGLLLVLRGAVKHGVTKDALGGDLVAMGLSPAHAGRVQSAWGATSGSLTEVAASGVFAMNELVDMQWKFGVAAASSEVARIGAPHVQLALTLDMGGGATSEVVLELTLPQFYDFLSDMEKAQAYVAYLAGGAAGGEAAP